MRELFRAPLLLPLLLLGVAALPARVAADEVDDAVAEAHALLKEGKADEARARLEPVAAAHPDRAPVQYALAQAAILKKDFPRARKHCEKTVELDPANVDARLVLAELYRADKKPKDARKQLDEVLKRDPENASALQAQGDVDRDLKRYPEAVGWYEKALEKKPDSPRLLALIAASWAEAAQAAALARNVKKRDECGGKAIDAYKRCLEVYPDGVDMLYNWGTVALFCERYDEAGEALEKYIEKKPDEARAVHNLAQVREKQGRDEDALALWRRFLEMAEKDKALKAEVANARARIKDLEKKLKKK